MGGTETSSDSMNICYETRTDIPTLETLNNIEREVNDLMGDFAALKDRIPDENLTLTSTSPNNSTHSSDIKDLIRQMREKYVDVKVKALEYKAFIVEKNEEFLDKKDKFTNAKNKLNFKKSDNLASGILKMDIYDRNIEDNIYIMYYLLSYGVMGFFIYKLLKQ